MNSTNGAFLNKKHGRAYTIAKVTKSTGPEKTKYDVNEFWSDHVSAYLEIGDCNDDACLEFNFSFSKPKLAKKQIEKMDKFIATCQKMREAMVKDNKKLAKKYKKWKKKQAKKRDK